MEKFSFGKELRFVHIEKVKMLDKEGTLFQLLNACHVLLDNYANTEKPKLRYTYKTVYWMTKKHYLRLVNQNS